LHRNHYLEAKLLLYSVFFASDDATTNMPRLQNPEESKVRARLAGNKRQRIYSEKKRKLESDARNATILELNATTLELNATTLELNALKETILKLEATLSGLIDVGRVVGSNNGIGVGVGYDDVIETAIDKIGIECAQKANDDIIETKNDCIIEGAHHENKAGSDIREDFGTAYVGDDECPICISKYDNACHMKKPFKHNLKNLGGATMCNYSVCNLCYPKCFIKVNDPKDASSISIIKNCHKCSQKVIPESHEPDNIWYTECKATISKDKCEACRHPFNEEGLFFSQPLHSGTSACQTHLCYSCYLLLFDKTIRVLNQRQCLKCRRQLTIDNNIHCRLKDALKMRSDENNSHYIERKKNIIRELTSRSFVGALYITRMDALYTASQSFSDSFVAYSKTRSDLISSFSSSLSSSSSSHHSYIHDLSSSSSSHHSYIHDLTSSSSSSHYPYSSSSSLSHQSSHHDSSSSRHPSSSSSSHYPYPSSSSSSHQSSHPDSSSLRQYYNACEYYSARK